MQHEEAVSLLKDIRPMDVSFWQALLEWLLFYGGVMLVCLVPVVAGVWWWRRRGGGTSRQVQQILRELEELKSSDLEAKRTATAVVMLLKRASLARFGREGAGMHGEAWLQWMDEQWPQPVPPFRWVEEGRLLLQLPYQPALTAGMQQQMQRLVETAYAWVEAVEAARDD